MKNPVSVFFGVVAAVLVVMVAIQSIRLSRERQNVVGLKKEIAALVGEKQKRAAVIRRNRSTIAGLERRNDRMDDELSNLRFANAEMKERVK